MKVIVPPELKVGVPQTTFGKILSATPVIMAVVATMLAGLASSEMTKAQYDRSLGAQQQSKAGDQWSFFQAKRLRGAVQENTVELLQNMAEVRPLTAEALEKAGEQFPAAAKAELTKSLDSPSVQQALRLLRTGEVPPAPEAAAPDPTIKAALQAMENLAPDSEMVPILAQVSNQTIESALGAARDRAQAFDQATRPVNQAIDKLDDLLENQVSLQREKMTQENTGGKPAGLSLVNRDLTVARLRFAALRYEVEARLNQAIANLYELQVRKSNISAEHHHARSQRFFFGMLAAQFGVIISTFSLAARNRNLLWSLAAGAGLLAIAFAIYVYLYV